MVPWSVTAIPGIRNKPNKFLNATPPPPLLSKRAVKSSHPSRLAEVCLAVGREGGRPAGREGGRGTGEPLHRGIRLCKQMSWLPFSSRAVLGRSWSSGVFFRDKRLGTGPVSRAHAAGTTQSRKVNLGQLPSKPLANNFQTGCNIDQRITTYIPATFDHQRESNIMWHFFELYACHLYCRGLSLLRSHPTETREYQTQFMSTSTSAMARGRGASTSALPTCPPMVTSLWICTLFTCLWHWRRCMYMRSSSRVFLQLLTYINYSLQ